MPDDTGKPINVARQEDASGFLTRLIDTINEKLKTKFKSSLTNVIQGIFSHQKYGHNECKHFRSDNKHFKYYLYLLKIKKIFEALDSMIEGEILNGSNKVTCDLCQKVDTISRTVIKKLPNTLIMSLSRFEIDYSTFQSFKINDRVEFPIDLNMKYYTEEYLTTKEHLQHNTNDYQFKTYSDGYYQYKLKGIIVHTGTVNGGHYYSFIQERTINDDHNSKWYKFNDNIVTEFDPNNIKDECFGGNIDDNTSSWNSVANGYILFYDRIKKYYDNDDDIPIQVENLNQLSLSRSASMKQSQAANILRIKVPIQIYNEILEENLTYWRDKNVYDLNYNEFLWLFIKDLSFTTDKHQVINQHPIKPINVHDAITRLSTRYLLTTYARAAHKKLIMEWIHKIMSFYTNNIASSIWLINILSIKSIGWIYDYLITCPYLPLRKKVVSIFNIALSNVYQYESNQEQFITNDDDNKVAEQASSDNIHLIESYTLDIPKNNHTSSSYCYNYIDTLLSFYKIIPNHYKRFSQYFQHIHYFIQLDSINHALYINKNYGLISRIIHIYLGTTTTNDDQANIRNRIHIDTPNLYDMYNVLKHLVINSDNLKQLKKNDLDMLLYKPFLQTFLMEAYNYKQAEIVIDIIHYLIKHNAKQVQLEQQEQQEQQELESESQSESQSQSDNDDQIIYENQILKDIIDYICIGLNIHNMAQCRPYFRIIDSLFLLDQFTTPYFLYLFNKIAMIIDMNSKYKSLTDFFIDHMIRLSKKYSRVYNYLIDNKQENYINFIYQWLQQQDELNKSFNLSATNHNSSRSLIDKPIITYENNIHKTILYFQDIHVYIQSCKYIAYNLTIHDKLTYINKLRLKQHYKANEYIDDQVYDSDYERNQRIFRKGDQIDALDTDLKWLKATIIEIDLHRDRIYINYNGYANKWDEWIDMNSTRIALANQFSKYEIEN